MFNRQLQVKMVKPSKDSENDVQSDVELERKITVISYHAGKFIDRIGRIALSYIVLDTIRQVVVTRAQQP